MRAAPLLTLLLVLAASEVFAQAEPVYDGDPEAIGAILAQSRRFSEAYEQGDIESLVAIYTEDGVAAPGGRDFIRGREALHRYWALPPGRVVTHHEATPVEVRVDGEHAYDWGYYEGSIQQDGEARDFQGKYLIVWRRGEDGIWRVAHDMWNLLPAEE